MARRTSNLRHTVSLRFSDTFAAQRIIFGAGSIQDLGKLVSDLGAERVLLVTSRSYLRNGVASRLASIIGPALAATFVDVRPHVPEESVVAALRVAHGAESDAVLALGGGSAMGTGKALTAALSEACGQGVPSIAIPTTYAGSEMTAVYGVTRGGKKHTVSDPRTLPRLVVYDPELTLDLPADLTAGTGANALAHCVEGIYSLRRTPLATAAALHAAGRIAADLPRLMADGHDRAARVSLLVGAHLAGVTIAHAGMALHHAICHALGGAGVPHGVSNAVMLPHVMRFNLTAAPDEIAAIGRAMQPKLPSLPVEAEAAKAIASIDDLLQSLPLPHRLRDVGISEVSLPDIAAHALQSATAQANPRKALPGEVEEILQAAW